MCQNNCSSNGVCSLKTNTCVCDFGFVMAGLRCVACVTHNFVSDCAGPPLVSPGQVGSLLFSALIGVAQAYTTYESLRWITLIVSSLLAALALQRFIVLAVWKRRTREFSPLHSGFWRCASFDGQLQIVAFTVLSCFCSMSYVGSTFSQWRTSLPSDATICGLCTCFGMRLWLALVSALLECCICSLTFTRGFIR